MHKFLKNIFSINDKADYRGNRIQIRVLGIKFNIIKPEIAKRRIAMPFDNYVKNNVEKCLWRLYEVS